jgi:hypothetical protein
MVIHVEGVAFATPNCKKQIVAKFTHRTHNWQQRRVQNKKRGVERKNKKQEDEQKSKKKGICFKLHTSTGEFGMPTQTLPISAFQFRPKEDL